MRGVPKAFAVPGPEGSRAAMQGTQPDRLVNGPSGTVSVIICAYTERRWVMLCGAIRSVQEQTRPPDEIVLVIDHETALHDRAVGAFTGVTVVSNIGRRGLSGARNSGILASSGEIIAFLDDDAVAAPDWLAALLTCYEDPSVIAAGGHATADWQCGRPGWFPEEFDWVVGCSYRGLRTMRGPVRNLIGCNMSFRREVFQTVGLFHEAMGRVGSGLEGCEETELCIRARRAAPECVIIHEPSARILHHVPASRSRWCYFLARCWGEGKSKSRIARLVGSGSGLESERRYVSRVLPVGIARALRDAILHVSPASSLRAVAIVSGLAAGTAGYIIESARRWLPPRPASPARTYPATAGRGAGGRRN